MSKPRFHIETMPIGSDRWVVVDRLTEGTVTEPKERRTAEMIRDHLNEHHPLPEGWVDLEEECKKT